MSEQAQDRSASRPLAVLALLLAVAWLATGASYKLFAGSPNDLPSVIVQAARDWGGAETIAVVYKAAIGIELFVVAFALLVPRIGWMLVLAQYAAFLVVLGFLIASGAESCGCMGSNISIPPGVMAGIDLTLVAMVLLTGPWSARFWGAPVALAGVVGIVLLALPWIHDRGAPSSGAPAAYVILDERSWVGRTVEQCDFAAHLETPWNELIPGTWVFYRDSCPHCAKHLAFMRQSDLQGEPIVLIKIPEDNPDPAAVVVDLVPIGDHVTHTSFPAGIDWVLPAPIDMRVEFPDYLVSRVRVQHEVEDGNAFPAADPAVMAKHKDALDGQ